MNVNISYQELLEIRRELDDRLYVEDRVHDYALFCQDRGMVLSAQVVKFEADGVTKTPEALDLEENLMQCANRPVATDEIRFETHDYSNKGTWSGESTGDPAASWSAERGAVSYDDATNIWSDASGGLVSFLDQNDPREDYDVWKDSEGSVIVRYVPASGDPCDGDWIRLDTSAVVTSSRWRITPYEGYKISISETVLSTDSTAVLQGPLHYEVYSYYPPLGVVIKVRDWVYKDLGIIRAGADTITVEPVQLPGHAGHVIHYSYDYRKTKIQVIDSRAMQRLDIVTEDDLRVVNTKGATATFLARKIHSF